MQTNASVDSSELLQSYWNADSSSLTVAGPSCHADSPLCYGVRSRLPLSVSRRQLPVSSFVQPTLFSRPLPLPDAARIQVQNPLSGFAPKQTKESSAWRATYIVLQLNRRLNLWNGMFDRHQAEITVIQFTGHSLPVHQSMRVPWDFLPCPISLAKHAYAISSHNCHWNVSLPSDASPRNGKFGRVEGQNTTLRDSNVTFFCDIQ